MTKKEFLSIKPKQIIYSPYINSTNLGISKNVAREIEKAFCGHKGRIVIEQPNGYRAWLDYSNAYLELDKAISVLKEMKDRRIKELHGFIQLFNGRFIDVCKERPPLLTDLVIQYNFVIK